MADDEHDHRVRIALRADLDAATATLVAAFHDDPWFSWLFPDESARPGQLAGWFSLVLERAFTMGHTFVAPGGVVDWAPPDVHFPGPDDVALAVAHLQGEIGERAGDAFGIIGALGPLFPDDPRFHCIYVAVDPGRQGGGVGTALLDRVLATCDREGLPASLTSTNDANLAFYGRLGFEEIGAVPIADTGRSMRPLWRAAR